MVLSQESFMLIAIEHMTISRFQMYWTTPNTINQIMQFISKFLSNIYGIGK